MKTLSILELEQTLIVSLFRKRLKNKTVFIFVFQINLSQSSRWTRFCHSDSQQHKTSLRAASEAPGTGAPLIQCLVPAFTSSFRPSRGRQLPCALSQAQHHSVQLSLSPTWQTTCLLFLFLLPPLSSPPRRARTCKQGWLNSRCLCLKICKLSSLPNSKRISDFSLYRQQQQ